MFSAGAGVFFPEPEFFLPEPEPEVKNPEFAQHYIPNIPMVYGIRIEPSIDGNALLCKPQCNKMFGFN